MFQLTELNLLVLFLITQPILHDNGPRPIRTAITLQLIDIGTNNKHHKIA